MNAAVEKPTVGYEQDFFAWSQRQAQLVRARRLSELDLDNLAEEIESMGKEVSRAVGSYARQILVHLLLQFSPARDPRSHWRGELTHF